MTCPVRAQTTALIEGVQLLRQKRFELALPKLEEAHRLAPRNAMIENLLGIVETQLGRIDEADHHYRNSIRLDSSQAAPHRNLGFNLLNAKDYLASEPELRMASRLDAKDHFAHYYLLLLALATGRDAEAVEQCLPAASLLDNDPEASAGVIEALIRQGKVADASSRIDHLRAANLLSPQREYAIAALLSQRGLNAEALVCFQHMSAQNSTWDNRYNLALALLFNQQFAESSNLLSTLHTERPTHADTLMFLGSAFEAQQKMPEALDAYRSAVVADPTNPDRTLDYTRLLLDMDRYDEAIQAVQTGMQATTSTEPLELRLGAVEMIKGDYPAARLAFNSALASHPDMDIAYVGLAQTYARQSNDTEAIRILEAARNQLHGHYALEYYFGLLASRLGREPEAIAALQTAAELAPDSPDPCFELGKIYLARKDWQQARLSLERVITLNPQFLPAHYQLSRIYVHLGLSEKAVAEVATTRDQVNAQREAALRKQRERSASFQPPFVASPQP
jgi:tetratricopeptide (TPR) repeat protein